MKQTIEERSRLLQNSVIFRTSKLTNVSIETVSRTLYKFPRPSSSRHYISRSFKKGRNDVFYGRVVKILLKSLRPSPFPETLLDFSSRLVKKDSQQSSSAFSPSPSSSKHFFHLSFFSICFLGV